MLSSQMIALDTSRCASVGRSGSAVVSGVSITRSMVRRYPQGYGCALTNATAHCDCSAVSLNEFSGEREPETTPANLPRLTGTRGVGSIETLEDMWKGFRGNACAGILDLQLTPPLFPVRSP